MIKHLTTLRLTTLHLAILFQTTMIALLILAGCSSNDPVIPPGAGTIVIETSPEPLPVGWILEVPGGGNVSGLGDSTLTDMAAGSYTLTWQPVDGWLTPDPAIISSELKSDTTLLFTATYVFDDPNLAVLIIDPEPDSVNPTWMLTWEDQTWGVPGAGTDTLSHQNPGDYTVVWGDVTGWVTPDSMRLTAVSPDTTTFTGTYLVDQAAYPTPTIDWNYGETPFPEGFPMIISGRAFDEHDGWLAPEAMTWISDRDGVVAAGVSLFHGNDLSVGEHQIRLMVEDSHGLAAEDTVTIQVVPVPALSPTVSVTLPDWGTYDVSQETAASPVFGWAGTDPVSTSGHPAYIRFLFMAAMLADGQTYAATRTQVEANLDFLVSESNPEWSNWMPYSENELERRITFPDLARLDSQNRVIHYLFVFQAWSETGAISSNWVYADNMANFHVAP